MTGMPARLYGPDETELNGIWEFPASIGKGRRGRSNSRSSGDSGEQPPVAFP
jgi:hypothetical protein